MSLILHMKSDENIPNALEQELHQLEGSNFFKSLKSFTINMLVAASTSSQGSKWVQLHNHSILSGKVTIYLQKQKLH